MSRSKKKPIIQLTHQIDKDTAHKKVRRKVKSELDKPEPDLAILFTDTNDVDDEYGTKFDLRYDCDDDDRKNAERK